MSPSYFDCFFYYFYVYLAWLWHFGDTLTINSVLLFSPSILLIAQKVAERPKW